MRPKRVGLALVVAAILGCHAGMAALVLASLFKLTDLRLFAEGLASWTLIPSSLHTPLALAVPLAEAGVGLAWLLGLWRGASLGAAVGLLVSFTLLYVAQATIATPPECGCFGAAFRHHQAADLAWSLLPRNIAMIGTLVVGGALALRVGGLRSAIRNATRADHPRRKWPPRASGAARGFTLIELLIAMAIIAIVVSLTIPSLGGLRRRAQELQSLANIRTHVVAHTAYTGDYDSTFLYATDPDATATVLRGGGRVVEVGYFQLTTAWIVPMADEHYGGDALHDSVRVPWKTFYPAIQTSHYMYAAVCIARPEYWNNLTRRSDNSQWRRTLIAEVTFPSAKGFLLEWGAVPDAHGVFYLPPVARIGMVDGSAVEERFSRLLPHYAMSHVRPGGWPVLHTLNGVRGRDLP